MRLDYALYGLAVVLFILSGLFFVFIKENEGQLVYVASTAVLGILSIGAGLAQRPKSAVAVSPEAIPAPPAPPPEPSPTITAPEAGSTEATAAAVSTTAIEPSPVTLPAVEAPPPVPAPVIQPEPAPTPDVASVTSKESKSELLQIRGINESRVAQLNSNGILSIQDLANASADDLASKLGVSPKIVKMWVGSAKKLAK
jgi:predicted flap endonuclease-1-like 5' DNA nuclease